MEGNVSTKRLPLLVLAFVLLTASAFASGEANNTIVGKTVDYLINDFWKNIGVMAVDGMIAYKAITEAVDTKSKTPIWYGLGGIIGVTSAFYFGPDLLSALQAKGIIG